MNGPGLIVPVRLDALMIGRRDTSAFGGAYANFGVLPYPRSNRRIPYLASVAVQQPFNGNAPLPQGIHLHWQLPYALRRGTYGESAMSLPKAPDRWLITRIVADLADPSAPPLLRSWVIESNYLSTGATWSLTTIPWNGDPEPQTYRYLGRVYDYDAWLAEGERGQYWSELTAMGYGIPQFAACYPNCRNVFGFVDMTLNDAELDPDTTAIAYTAGGWYSDPASDPLASGSVGGWIYDAPNGEGPGYSLFQGAVYGLRWRPEIAYFPGAGVSLLPEIAIGNTTGEAFSALAAYQLRDQPFENVETLLNALQLGGLQYLGQPGGTARLEEALFSDEFAAADGGTIWQIEPRKDGSGGARARRRVDDPLVQGLETLNAAQRELDDELARKRSLQLQIFADWNKYMIISYTPDPARYPNADRVRQFIQSEVSALNDMTATIAGLTAEVESRRASLAAALPPELALNDNPAPRYYQPNDLVVVLSGDGVPPPPPDAAPDARCILTSQLLSSMTLPANLVPGGAAATIDASSLPTVADPSRLPYAALAQLVQATILADPQLAPLLASSTDQPAAAGAIAAAQEALLARIPPPNGIAFTGALPQASIGFRKFETPWNPIALSWRFEYTPLDGSEGPLDENYVLDHFRFDERSLDFEPRQPQFAASPEQYTGSILLSSDASINVQREIRRYLEYFDDPELSQILAALGNYPLLAQSLGGFDAAMMMLATTLQLQVADPGAAIKPIADFSNVTVRNAVGEQNKVAPEPATLYNPLRAGRLRLAQLVLTDSFGRLRDVSLARLAVSETIPANESREMLPPLRLTQTAQVDLRWLSADPICGWVVPNHLDASLMFYDAEGGSLGSLFASGDRRRLIWQRAPGSGTPGETMEEAFAGRNPVLRAFAMSMREHGAAYVTSLIRTIDRTRTFIAPENEQQNLQTAVLIGAPLAIVQARASLRLLGLPSPDQSYDALRIDIDRGDPLRRSVHDFTGVRFPLLLGSLSEFNDGLIGYFLASADGSADFDRFYAAAANGDDAHIEQPQTGTITLAAADAGKLLTMLVDPRAGVHAFTGIAPVKMLTIPDDAVTAALRAMTFTFLTTPILSLESGLAVPQPAQLPSANWTWIAYRAEEWVETDIAGINYEATLQTPKALLEGWMKLTERKSTEEQ